MYAINYFVNMIQINFTKEQIDDLFYARFNYPHPPIQKRIEALYLKSMGLSPGDICDICRISRPVFAKYLHWYQEKGIDGLKDWNYKGQPSQLQAHSKNLKKYFEKHPPATSNQAVDVIEKLTGIKRSPTQVREFMKRIGMSFKKTGFVPKGVEGEAKQHEQKDYVKKNSTKNYSKPKKMSEWCFS